MKWLKNSLFIFLIIYVCMDYYGYYYGIGHGFFNIKLPVFYFLDYGTFDKQHPSVSVMDSDLNTFLVHNNQSITLENGKKIRIEKILGYYIDYKDIIVKVSDYQNKKYNIRIIPHLESEFQEEMNVDKENYKYIDIENREKYLGLWAFGTYFVLFIAFLISILIFFVYVYRVLWYVLSLFLPKDMRE